MLSLGLGKLARHGGTILCIGAHCDDIEIGCGGTLLKLLEQNPALTCHWIVFSGTPERAAECQASAERFLRGAADRRVDVLDFRDGFLPAVSAEVKDRFEALGRQIEPDLILTHYRDDRHQDHRLLSDLTWNTWRNHLVLEYEIPKYDGDLGRPNVYVTLSEGHCRQKIDHLMACYSSQASKRWFTEDTFRALLRLRGIEAASETGFAEAFHGRKVVL